MRKLAAVEQARAVMAEGMDWSAWRWLLERARVREIADRATAALDRADQKVKAAWPAELKQAYHELVSEAGNRGKRSTHNSQPLHKSAPELRNATQRVKEADDEAERCRLAAEDIFDKAERRFSAELARQGARKALRTYDLREAAIRTAEAIAEQTQGTAAECK